ncbi:putative membrane protein [Bacillus thermophilus]|uniref:Membrane protein n=1 Tax=Siminovitchia thermophila TaxID=1245522 RepID=A0ABS2R555_9BACI|nr:small multi-drug export protein [Siminovitchia thermophila]MBM7714768.1 putative membrane protein [Siminovitchia thermophila]ONK24466.1 DNA-binding protein [Bacillus sp. VT-16-64]
MGSIWEYVIIFLLAAVPWIEVAAVIPLGIIRGLSSTYVVIVAFLGNLSTIILLVYLFDKIKDFWVRKKGEQKTSGKRLVRAKRIWNKYGLPGLSLLGPIFIGIHIAAFIGLTLGATRNWTLLWMTSSLALWSIVFGVAAHYGLLTFKMLF